MADIHVTSDGGKLTIALGRSVHDFCSSDGRLPEGNIRGVTDLVMDLKLAYIASAGLRVLPAAMKLMKKQSSMVMRKVNETVMEVFEINGFADMLAIEYSGLLQEYTNPIYADCVHRDS